MDPHINSKVYLKEIPLINGWGVFTNENIKTGEIIEVSPVFIYPKKIIDLSIYISLGEGMNPASLGIDQYGILWNIDDENNFIAATMLGYLSLYNHSNHNNAMFEAIIEKRLVKLTAIRDIVAEEQITVSYGEDWFNQKNYLNYIDF